MVGGNLARIFTTLTEVDDMMILGSFLISTVLNTTLVCLPCGTSPSPFTIQSSTTLSVLASLSIHSCRSVFIISIQLVQIFWYWEATEKAMATALRSK